MKDKNVIIAAEDSMMRHSKSTLLFVRRYLSKEEKNSMLKSKEH